MGAGVTDTGEIVMDKDWATSSSSDFWSHGRWVEDPPSEQSPAAPETALVPQTRTLALRDELAIAQRQESKAIKKKENPLRVAVEIVGLLGASVGVVLLAVHPAVAAMLVMSGVWTIFKSERQDMKLGDAARRAKWRVEEIEQRIIWQPRAAALDAKPARLLTAAPSEDNAPARAALTAAAAAEMDRAFGKVQPETGLELPFATEDHSRKIVRIEAVDTRKLLDNDAVRTITTVTARIYDALAQENGDLDLGLPVPDVPAFKRKVAAPEKRLT